VKSSGIGSYLKGYIMALLLSMTTMIYGMNVARSIIQEKTSRIFEVMLATAKPSDLLAGKLIGVGAVGLTQIGIWVLCGVAIGSVFAAQLLNGQLAIHFSWVEVILFPTYFSWATCCTPRSSQDSLPRARPSRNCRCIRLWPHCQSG